jgi:formylglycine-generating enzyme required for sulfatase activity
MNILKKLFGGKTESQKQSNPKDFGEWDMVFVKGGAFTATLGDIDENRQETVIRKNVKIADFYIGRYPVTRSQWFSVMEDKTSETDGKLPVEFVSWEMAQAFIGKLNEKTGKNFRLPTAAEWEYAATGGQQSKRYKLKKWQLQQEVDIFKDGYEPYRNNAMPMMGGSECDVILKRVNK